MFQTVNIFSFLLYFLILALIIAVINFIIGLYLTLKMASLRGLTKDKKPALMLNGIWSIITFIFSLFPWTMFLVFLINLVLGLIAMAHEEFYGLKEFRKRLSFLLVVLIVQLILMVIIWVIGFALILYYITAL